MGCKSHKLFIFNGPPDLCKPGPLRSAQRPRPPPSKQPAAVGNARGRGGCRARERPLGKEQGLLPHVPVRPSATTRARTPLPRAPGARSHVWPQLPMATGRWYTSRQMGQVNCASSPLSPPAGPAGGCRCCAEATKLRNIAIPGQAAAAAPYPGRQTGVTAATAPRWRHRSAPRVTSPQRPLAVMSSRRAGSLLPQSGTSPSMCQAGEDYAGPAQREPPPVPRPR